MQNAFRLTRFAGLSLALFTFAACSQAPNGTGLSVESSSLMPPPASASSGQPISLQDQLKRFRGQTEFANAVQSFGRPEAARAANSPSGGGSPRSEQESDIFKIGKKGSNLLFLLNNSRGLQVVSFAKGADHPELVGRVKATGNYPDDMYYDEAGNRLLVLERLWYSTNDTVNSDEKSRILVYDVANPSDPKITAVVPIKGEIADSRMVGQVLYIATTQRPQRGGYSTEKSKGVVLSYSVAGSKIAKIEEAELSLPAVYGSNINIQTVQNAAGGYSYYLVAVLSETGWGWWDRQSLVEVIDISDEKGKIKPLMTVSAKGSISERSQTRVQDGHLIVTSNYRIDAGNTGNNRRSIARIAVETFRLPTANAEVITEKEAAYRQMHIDREMQAITQTDIDAARVKLLADPKIGLTGRFVSVGGKLRKPVPEHVITVGDTTGQSSSLQDVRYQDGLLYAFWVPTNLVDPLDIFDIRNLDAGPKHLSRLTFDGWIAKAIPMSLGGRQFVVGLGWIVPAVNNERNLRRPQAMIFEIKQVGSTFKAQEVAQLTFSSGDVWTDFNSPDKFIEVRENGDGTGQILFSASSWNAQSYQSGGKILNFDLGAILKGDSAQALNEGVFLAGRSDWLRRVFTNTEIDRINTFSDKALGVFNAKSASTDKLVKASAVLELARNIRAYHSLPNTNGIKGIQVISDYSYYGDSEASKTTLRVTSATTADAEVKAVLSEVTVQGSYVTSVVAGDALYLISNSSRNSKDANGRYVYTTISYVNIFKLDESGNVLQSKFSQTIENDMDASVVRGLALNNSRYGESLVLLPNQQVLAQLGGKILSIDSKTFAMTELATKGCSFENRTGISLKSLGSKLVVLSASRVDAADVNPAFQNVTIMKNYMSPAELSGHEIVCSSDINVPGEVLALNGSGLMTNDNWTMDISVKTAKGYANNGATDLTHEQYELENVQSVMGLVIKGGKAVLVDELGANVTAYSVQAVGDGQLVRLSEFKSDSGYGGFMDDDYSPGFGQRRSGTTALEFIAVDAQGELTQEKTALKVAGTGYQPSLLGVFAHPKENGVRLGVIGFGQTLQVVKWNDSDKHAVAQKVVPLNEKLERMPAVDAFASSSSYYSNGQVHFTRQQMSFEVSEGLNGITQFFLE